MFMMNLSAPFLCEFYKEPMLAALPYVDVLFGNETEADTFAKVNDFQTTDRKEIALKVSQMRKMNEKRKRIVVITQGADNILVAKDNQLLEFPAIKLPKEKVVDTNGAGDAFVGGSVCFSSTFWLPLKLLTFLTFLTFLTLLTLQVSWLNLYKGKTLKFALNVVFGLQHKLYKDLDVLTKENLPLLFDAS